ncbi:hypothetical protein BBJ28_00015327 [Nothophytophthora sp. Chile5]|nr:hypothetical protein BBJ28_00015327 [Nothophytophthora sp. Chile5]
MQAPSTLQQSASIFQFRREPGERGDGLAVKSQGRRGSTTPRNLVFPDLSAAAGGELPTAPSDEGAKLSASAKKYLHTNDQPVEPKVRVKPPRSFRGKLRFYLGDGKTTVGAARTARQALAHLSLQQSIAFVLMLAGMMSEAGTPAPRYNVPVGLAVVLLPVAATDGDVALLLRHHHRLYVTGLSLTTASDFIWLMRPQEGAFNGYFLERTKSFTDVWLALCAVAKIWLIFCTYLELVDTEPPLVEGGDGLHEAPVISPPSHRLWDEIKHFFPRRTLPRRAELSLDVLRRVLALAWLHLLCGALLLVLGLVATAWYSGRTQFRARPLGVPLYVMLLLKAATTLLCYLTISHRLNYDACLELYGLRSRDANSGLREVDGVQVRLPQEPVLAYNRVWLRRVQRAKALDGLFGGYLLLVFYAALRSGQIVGGRGVPALLACTGLVLLVLDVWTPLLILVAARCGAALHALHRRGIPGTDPLFPPQLRWEDSDEEDSDSSEEEDSEEDEDDGSDDDGETSDGNISAHSSSSEDAQGTPAERRERRLRHRQRRLERQLESQLPIVDAHEAEAFRRVSGIGSPRESAADAAWVRHWHEASGRAYLVHSITGEAVWEIVKGPKKTKAKTPSSSESSDVADDGVTGPSLTPMGFEERWDELADGGGFTCRVSRIPGVHALANHLRRQRFRVVSDGLRTRGVQQERVILFYTDVSDEDGAGNADRSSTLLFLGELVFDSLSLKLRARFRCFEPEEIVPFVKRLQLKEIVGAYAPCD